MTAQVVDVIIVGGGVMGLSLALSLRRRGVERVVVVERSQIGAGSTGRSVASVFPLTTHPTFAALQRRTLDIWTEFQADIGSNAEWVSMPVAVLSGPDHHHALITAVEVAETAGLNMELLSPDVLTQRIIGRTIHVDDLSSVAVMHDSGYINPEQVTLGYASAARQLNVGIWEGYAVQSILVENGRVLGVQTQAGRIEANTVVLAAGVWTRKFLASLGMKNPLQDADHVVGIFDVPPKAPPLNYGIIDLTCGLTYRYAIDNRYVFQPMMVSNRISESAMNLDPSIYISYMTDLREHIVSRFPSFEASVLQPGWSGLWDLTPDGYPIVGSTPVDGLYISAGTGNSGFEIIPALTQQLAGLIVGDIDDAKSLEPFSMARFLHDTPSYNAFGNLII